jgi:hypothetical protein
LIKRGTVFVHNICYLFALIRYTLLLTILFSALLAAHPVHVSVTNLDINTEKDTIFITQKMFTDDFELLFYHLYEKTIKPLPGKDFSQNELNLVNGYMKDAFVVESGSTRLPLGFIRKDQDEQSIWLYYTCPMPSKSIRSLMLTNSLLLQLYEDQTNLVIVTYKGADSGYTFNYNSWKSEISLKNQ